MIAGFGFTGPQLGGGIFVIATYIFLFLVAVLWFLLPFAVFGIKPLLKELIGEMRRMNESQR